MQKMVFDSYREGDCVAVDTIKRFKLYLSKAMANMINTLNLILYLLEVVYQELVI